MALRILLADDHVVVRQGLRMLLEQAGLTVVGEASDGDEAVRMAGELRPDAVVLDLAMPRPNGLDATRLIPNGRDPADAPPWRHPALKPTC